MNPDADNIKRSNNDKQTYYYSNIFLSDFTDFIGRTQELQNLLKHISPKYRQHITIVDGIDGIGKTSLVLQAAYLCQTKNKKPELFAHINIPKFEEVIFVSLKKTYLNANIQIKRLYKNYGLQYIFKTIASTLKKSTEKIHQTLNKKQIEAVYQCLNQQDTLLIIDNLELVKGTEKDKILLFLSNLPEKVQAIITTREKVDFYSSISLDGLSQEARIKLIEREAKKKDVVLTESESIEICHLTDGIPLAIIYAIGLKKQKKTIKLSNNPSEDKTYLLCKQLLEQVDRQLEYRILNSLSFFSDSSSIEALAAIANIPPNSTEIKDAIKKLEDLSLLECKEERYLIYPVSCEYLVKEFIQDTNFEEDARDRWFQWYLDLAKKYGGRDWANWKYQYKQLKIEWNNLLAVLEWYATNNDYERVRDLWKNINQFANLENYWHDRLFWLTWLIEESQKREDWHMAAYAMSEKSFTLIHMGDFSEAESLLDRALDFEKVFGSSSQKYLENQTLIYQHFALLYIALEDYQQAFDYLEKERSCINDIESKKKNYSDIKPKEIIRRRIAVDTVEAEIYFKQEKYPEAELAYKAIVKKAAQIGWHRRKEEAQARINLIQPKLLPDNSRSKKRNIIKNPNHYLKSFNNHAQHITSG